MVWFIALLPGCHHQVSLRVLEPADVTLPADIQRIAVLDRHTPRDRGQAVLDVLEGALSGEAVNMDREGARSAVSGAVARLQDGPRFEGVVPLLERGELPTDIFDRPLTQDQVRELCRRTNTDALIALDAFDTDASMAFGSHTEVVTDSHGREIATLIHDVALDVSGVSSWRLYHPDLGVLDEVRELRRADSWVSSGLTPAAAQAGLIHPWETARILGQASGLAYGARISPTWIFVDRVYYGHGDPRLKEARRHVKANDWPGARAIWTEMSEDPDRKLRGRALFNLALAHEVEGELYPARRVSKEAAVALANGRSRTYVRQLEQRVEDRLRLKEQMAAPEPAGTPAPTEGAGDPPLAVPAESPAPAPRPEPSPRPAPVAPAPVAPAPVAPAPVPAPAPTRLERPR